VKPPQPVNRLTGVARLVNRYHVMRHGQSKANVAGIIVSRIDTDRRGDYGLSERGREQALMAAKDCGLPPDTIICSSDFARARETALIVREQLGGSGIMLAEALRERSFGPWEGSSNEHYAQVWAADEASPDKPDPVAAKPGRTDGGEAGPVTADRHQANPDGANDVVESAAAVLARTTALVADLERRYSGGDILLVAHGDPLQILQAGFLGLAPSRHRSLPPLETAEIRLLRLVAPASERGALP
jgi:broad specificity phosphatase PhoE